MTTRVLVASITKSRYACEMMPAEGFFYEEEEEDRNTVDGLIGKSLVWRKVLQQLELVAASNTTVLITGESGTGKELVAKAIHAKSARRNRPIVKVNCAAIAPDLFESEFFGHTKGSFTGAHKDRMGRFGLADGGTIFLDEVGEIPLALQGKLLRVLQEGQYERVGEDHTRKVDVRVLAATNRELIKSVEAGAFRQDLFYRLSVFPIHIPPLRERLDDVPLLAEHFLQKMNWRDRCHDPLRLSEENLVALQNYHYPGNVRELENIIERARILSNCLLYKLDVQEILDAMLLSEQRKQLASSASEPSVARASSTRIMTYAEIKNLERDNLIAALQATNYKIYGASGAAELLGVKPTTLASRIKALQISLRPTAEQSADVD
ncbi:MAG: sigma 54-interacting transcriptional regulator [Acidobacteriota bacterium]